MGTEAAAEDQAAIDCLRRSDRRLRPWIDAIGPIPLPRLTRFTTMEAVGRSIVFQQLHGKAAQTILDRVLGVLGSRRLSASAILAADPARLRAAGLSQSKLRALLDLAEHVRRRQVPGAAELATLDDAEVVRRLTVVRGVGPWTAEMLLMFRLGRQDVLPVSDYGIRAGAQVVHQLPELPKAEALQALAEAWRPYRSLACLYLWRALERSRERA